MKSTPDGLKVKIKPHGALVETPKFKEKWQETITASINLCWYSLKGMAVFSLMLLIVNVGKLDVCGRPLFANLVTYELQSYWML